jgi:DNA-binding response OmpR family regulator
MGREDSSAASSRNRFAPAAVRVLLVEDEPKLRASLADGLQLEDWQVTTAENGQEAFRLLESQPFDLLLLDWMLPDQDGLEILRFVRAKGSEIPVLVVTARSTHADEAAAFRHGANGYLLKPFAFAELLARCRALLGLK